MLFNGKILTVDARDSIAQAVAIAGGKIVAVGSTDAVQIAHRRRRPQVIDLRGRTVTPGLIDTHVHFSEVDALFTVDLSERSPRSTTCWRASRDQVARLKPGEWVRGRGWDEGKFAERRYITAADLDKVAPEQSGVADADDRALRRREQLRAEDGGGDGSDTKDSAGRHDRPRRAGQPDRRDEGIGAWASCRGIVPPFTRDQQKRRHRSQIIEDFNKEGMTGAKDPGIGQQKWELYQELLEGRQADRAGVRAVVGRAAARGHRRRCSRACNANPRPPASLGDGVLLSGGVKMFMDGSGGARTAWMHEDWNKNFTEKDTGNHGLSGDAARRVPADRHRRCTTRASTSARTPSAIARSTGSSTPTHRRSRRSRRAACATASSTTTRRPITPST